MVARILLGLFAIICLHLFTGISFGPTYNFAIRENGKGSISCSNSPYNAATVTWSLTTTSGQTLDLGTCTNVGNCTSPHAPDITVQRPNRYRSQVNFQTVNRSKGGELFCSHTYSGLTETDNATLTVYSPATVNNCHTEVHPGNWSIILSCDISNVFSSSGYYYFSVNDTSPASTDLKRYGLLSYRDVLTPYTNRTDNKLYYRGRLTHSWPLSPTPTSYTSLVVHVFYNLNSSTAFYVGYSVNITRPSQPTHNCTELNYIPETGVVPCVCTADYVGSPAGRLVWLLGDVPLATGDYGVTQLTFPSGQVSRQHDGMMVTCQLDWVQPITAFTSHVAGISFGSTYNFAIRENGTDSISCSNSPYNTSTVTWSLTTTSGQTLDLGTCTDVGNCTSPHAPDITVQRPNRYRSQVNFQTVNRSKGGELFCSYTYSGLTETDNATLTVYSPVTVNNCHTEVHPGNWSAIVSCNISNVFSSSGYYYFSVNDTSPASTDLKRYGLLSYRDVLTPYTNRTDNKLYYRGRLTHSWPLSPTPASYTSLVVHVFYNLNSSTAFYVGYSVNITRPSQPTHNCTELNYIPETGVVPCVCTADYVGSPAGRLVWLLGDVPLATGDYGVTQLTFPSGQVSRQHDGMMVTCQLDWVQPITAFTSHVAGISFGSTYNFAIRENGTDSISCSNSPYNTSTVTWSLTTTSGQTLDLGTCTDVGKCTSPHAPNITLQRPNSYRSQVNFQMVNRSKGGELFCSYTYSGLTETDNATLTVYSPATVNNCHTEVHPGNWSAIVSCNISNVFSSSGYYYFSVNDTSRASTDLRRFGLLSYRDVLTPYTNKTDKKLYYRGRLTHSWPLSPTPASYTSLVVHVFYGISSSTAFYVGYSVNITRPSQPTHNCTELNHIPETGGVPCVCTADYVGSPAGRLVWLQGGVPLATGDYGMTQLTFPSGQVSRQHDGMMVTCQLDWVQPITAFTSHVADVDNVKLNINLTLKYVLLTVCTRVTENQVETEIHAIIVRENQEWPGFCTDSACSKAQVTGTCDGDFSKSITTVVVLEQVPVTLLSTVTQNTSSPRGVLLRAAVEEDAFDLKAIGARLIKNEILVSARITCTYGYIYTGTHCVKPDEPSSVSPLLIGSSIGGVLSFLVVVILIVLVVVVYRRLQQPDNSRREKQDDEHDYSSLTPAGRYAAPDHSGVELGGLDLDLTKPSLDDQRKRPGSDYDVIGDENPEIAKYLAESSLDKEQPGYMSPIEDKEDYITPCSSPKSSEDKNDLDYITPCSPPESSEDKNDLDYITPCSPPESSEDKNDLDYITPCSPPESSEDKNDSDNLTP